MDDNFLGQITLYACSFAPAQWAMCQGQLLPVQQYTALFSLLGTNFGGDGVRTFGLPDLRGRLPNGMGQAPGLSDYSIGETGGENAVTLTDANNPPHSHSFAAYNVAATTGSPAGALPAVGASTGEREHVTATKMYIAANPNVTLANNFVNPVSGGARPHDNMQPALAMNWCIALTGVYPPRS
jgi:microcystin-dependent protein